MWLLISVALAQAPNLEDFVEVTPVANAQAGILTHSEAWMPIEEACVRVAIAGQTLRLAYGPGDCVRALELDRPWWTGGVDCPDSDDDGDLVRGWPATEHWRGAPTLVALDDKHAEWRLVSSLRADGRSEVTSYRCSQDSLAAIRAQVVGDDLDAWLRSEHRIYGEQRSCSRATELVLGRPNPGPGWVAAGGVIDFDERSIIDCRQPCPQSDLDRQIAQANTWFEGRSFSRAGEPVRAIYASKQACEAVD